MSDKDKIKIPIKKIERQSPATPAREKRDYGAPNDSPRPRTYKDSGTDSGGPRLRESIKDNVKKKD